MVFNIFKKLRERKEHNKNTLNKLSKEDKILFNTDLLLYIQSISKPFLPVFIRYMLFILLAYMMLIVTLSGQETTNSEIMVEALLLSLPSLVKFFLILMVVYLIIDILNCFTESKKHDEIKKRYNLK